MSAPICFIDTETTGLHPGRLPWEIAVIRREPDGSEREWAWLVEDVDLSNADPFGLRVGRFYERHYQFIGIAEHARLMVATGGTVTPQLLPEAEIAVQVDDLTRGAHIVGAVPNFDTETLAPMLRRHGRLPGWHYHLIDVETLAVGWLSARSIGVPLPWSSDDLSKLLGVEPASDEDRHTALGDARWAMRIYDAILGDGLGAQAPPG